MLGAPSLVLYLVSVLDPETQAEVPLDLPPPRRPALAAGEAVVDGALGRGRERGGDGPPLSSSSSSFFLFFSLFFFIFLFS